MRIISLAFLACWLLLAGAAAAHADPISIISAVASIITGGLANIGQLILGILLKVGMSLLQKAFAKKPKEPGVQTDITFGGDNPQTIIMGTFGTAGQLEYANTWGKEGKTQNAYLTYVISIADLPLLLTGLWVDKKKITLPTMTGSPPVEQGWPISEFNKKDKDYLWVKFYDGTQAEADPFLIAKFGSDPDLPWSSDMIGRGVPYVILTARLNSKLFGGIPEYFFETSGIKLYDVSRDSSAGGSGSHRWDNPATWEPSSNPVVHAYNIVRGIRYGSEWVYGGQTTQAYQLPVSNWIAGINAANQTVALKDGGSEARYRAGCQIGVDQEPLEVIESLMKGCSGRFAEIGGIYKVLIGTPGAPIYSFTDESIVITEGQSYDPFPGLESTFNGASCTYPEPGEMWAPKEAPAYYRSDLEVLDDNRRLVTGIVFATVPYAVQVQRLLKEIVEDNRRFRVHQFYLPPEAWLLEPNDVVAWTSNRNSYSNKKFLVTEIAGASNMLQLVTLREIDPSDYSWNPLTDQKPFSIGFLNGPLIPPPQNFTGWAVEPYTFFDADGVGRRPGILVKADGDLDDVEFVRVQIRRAGTEAVLTDQAKPYGDPATNSDPLLLPIEFGGILPNTDYEARGLLVPFADARETEWSEWLFVTTPDVRFGADDFWPISPDQINDEFQELLDDLNASIIANQEDADNLRDSITALAADLAAQAAEITADMAAQGDLIAAERDERIATATAHARNLRDLGETALKTGLQLSDLMLDTKTQQLALRETIVVSESNARAYSDTQLNLAVGPTSSIAQRLTTLGADIATTNSTLSAAVTTLEEAIADGDAGEASARQALELRVTGGSTSGTIGDLTSGLIYQANQAMISETTALASAIALVSAGVGILFDPAKTWNFDTTADGWTGNGTPTAAGGYLRPADHASDPYIVSLAGLAVPAATYRQVKTYLRKTGAPTWEGYVWYKRTGDSTWDVSRRVTLAEPIWDGSDRAIATWEMTAWDGTIDQVRIDLTTAADGSNYVELDWVSIGRPSPGASQAQVAAVQTALSTALLAEASSRELLSTMLVGQADPTGLTLPSLTNGLVYQERQARISGDGANASLIAGIQLEIDDAASDIGALVGAQSAMQATLTNHEGRITLNTSDIGDTIAQLAGKASTGITDGLQSQINAITSESGPETFLALSETVRNIRATLEGLALQSFDGWLRTSSDIQSVASAQAEVNERTRTQVEATEAGVTLLGEKVTTIQLALPGYATLDITSALTGRITATENEQTIQGNWITSINAALPGKADASALSELEVIVSNQGDTQTSLANQIAALNVALNDKASGAALSSLQALVASQGDVLSAQGTQITSLSFAVEGKADASALSSLQSIVTSQGNTNTTQSTQITSLQNALSGYNGSGAVASAFSSLGSQVSTINGQVSSLATSYTNLNASYNSLSAGGRFQMSVGSAPSGWSARGVLEFKVSAGSAARQAGIYFDVDSTRARTTLRGDQLAIQTSAGQVVAFFDSTGTYIDKARIRNLDADNITANRIDAKLILQDGTAITDLIAANAVTDIFAASTDAYVDIINTSSEVTIQTLTVSNPKGARTVLSTAFEMKCRPVGDTTWALYVIRIKRNGTTIYSFTRRYHPQDASSGDVFYTFDLLRVDASPGAGTHTYTITTDYRSLYSNTPSGATAQAGFRNMTAIVAKK